MGTSEVTTLQDFKNHLLSRGYLHFVTRVGVLQDDELYIHPDTIKAHEENAFNTKRIYVFKCKPLNAWSSTQTVRTYRKLCKCHIKILEEQGY